MWHPAWYCGFLRNDFQHCRSHSLYIIMQLLGVSSPCAALVCVCFGCESLVAHSVWNTTASSSAKAAPRLASPALGAPRTPCKVPGHPAARRVVLKGGRSHKSSEREKVKSHSPAQSLLAPGAASAPAVVPAAAPAPC